MYKVLINTEGYIRSIEHETINSYMEALNGWSYIEEDMQTLIWRINTFTQNVIYDNWDDDKEDYILKYKKWINKPENKLTYFNALNKTEVSSPIKALGAAYRHFNLEKVLNELEDKGEIKIPFKWCYNFKDYLNNFDGCYMQIKKVNF